MTTSGFFISGADFNTLPAEIQNSVLALLKKAPEPFAVPSSDVDENFVELSLSQARDFLKPPMADKTRATIEAMVSGPTPSFRLKDIVKALGLKRPSDLRGVWAGITRRTHSNHGDDAYLVSWSESDMVYADGVYVDQGGQLTLPTYRSFRRALGLDQA